MRKEAKLIGKVANGLAFTKSAKLDKTFRHRYPDSDSPYYAQKKPALKQKKASLKVADGKKAVAVQKVAAVPEKQVSFEKEARVYPIRSIQRQIFSGIAKAAAVAIITVISIFGFGHLVTGKASAQDNSKPKTGQNVTQKKMTWGDVKAKFKTDNPSSEKSSTNKVHGEEYYKITVGGGKIRVEGGTMSLKGGFVNSDVVDPNFKSFTEQDVIGKYYTKVNGVPVCYIVFNKGVIGMTLEYKNGEFFTSQPSSRGGSDMFPSVFIAKNGAFFASDPYYLIAFKPTTPTTLEPVVVPYKRMFGIEIPPLENVTITAGGTPDFVDIHSPTMGGYKIVVNVNTLQIDTGIPDNVSLMGAR